MEDFISTSTFDIQDAVPEAEWEMVLSAPKIRLFRERILRSGFDSARFLKLLMLLTQQLAASHRTLTEPDAETVFRSPVIRDYIYEPFPFHTSGD